jgi:stage II sporulation protein D
VISALKGNYKITGDNNVTMFLSDKDVLYISLLDKQLLVRNLLKPIGNFTTLRLECLDNSGVIRINPVTPVGEYRQYNDNLIISVAYNRISLINEVQPDNYIAGVVEAESGSTAELEFYKAQSILARTYLYGHFYRHQSEDFQMCDGVHCQAYKGRSVRNPAIVEATKATSGLVVVAQDSSFITAVFHANCGGETESAANAWLNGKNYLISVKDPFCQNSSSAKWTKTITLDQWKSYLANHSFKFSKNISPGKFDFLQINRRGFYAVGKDSIPTKQIRSDFQLRSAFFSVEASKNEITFKGRGFGHGVGMCQDGAMQMAKIGYKYSDILTYYYKGTRIVSLSQVMKFDIK